jgi:hypothetical protein
MLKTSKLFKAVLFWRLAVLFLIIPSFFLVPLLPGHTVTSESFTTTSLLDVWSNFDGLRFLALAKEGYGTPHTFYSYSLFPLYPKLITAFSFLGGYLSSALIISNLCLFLSALVFVKLASLDIKAKHVTLALFLIAIFPSSFFLGSIYSESLFLLLSLLSFYFARRNRFLPAVILASLASYTRPFGLLIWPALIVEYFYQNKSSYLSFVRPRFLLLLIPPLGAFSYLRYLSVNTSDILNFLPSIPQKLVFIHQVFFRYLKMVVFIDHGSPLFLVVLTEIFVGVVFFLLLIFSFKHIRRSYWVYFLLSYLIPTFWGNFVGMPRFMLMIFPAFIFLAPWLERQHPFIRLTYYTVNIFLLIINLSLFARGYFVG